MDVYVALLPLFFFTRPASAFGSDPDEQIDIIDELDRENATNGITPVGGLHNGSKAFLFRDAGRAVHAPARVTEKVLRLFRGQSEFTFLASVQQKSSTSGVVFSIHEAEHSYFELESSGVREEIRYRYRFKGKPRSESFPYRLADGVWHKIAVSISASHLLLHVDCNRIYERVIDPPQMELTPGSGVWLGQHSHKHGLFKGIIQDVKLVFAPNGYIAQCPNLNRTCPTCSDFSPSLCSDIDECSTRIHYCRSNTACFNLPGGHRCDCLPGFIRVDEFSCTEHDECAVGQSTCDENAICTNTIRGHLCTCKPGYVGNGTECKAFCEDGCRSGGTCVSPNTCVCPSGFTGRRCETDIDECSEGLVECHGHARCANLPGWYHCECRSGFHDNGSYLLDGSSCRDVDECSLHTHTCWNDSVCVNLPGAYDCVCPSGPGCSGDCPQEDGLRRNGEAWRPSRDRCAVCACKDGQTFCRRRPCDCGDPEEDPSCCPGCDNRPGSRCLDQSGRSRYRSGASWLHGCQQCRCVEGEAACRPLACPVLTCESTAMAEGECCPRCAAAPCLADSPSHDVRQTCQDAAGTVRLSGDTWRTPAAPCTACKCENGNVCCSVDLDCLQNN
ncbi:protein kinase C-binding protein NELL1-like [Brachionichthys hirsutus]|uniref:protein kinase C-binding protein NELL1-like n=1 Tax=Brachionichthys hirsutus TaxID=412623 RepID=UPI00360435E6